jgi:hypothetical protein
MEILTKGPGLMLSCLILGFVGGVAAHFVTPGPQGTQGEQGVRGPRGATGPAGPSGVSLEWLSCSSGEEVGQVWGNTTLAMNDVTEGESLALCATGS